MDKKLTDSEIVKALERLIEVTSKDILISNKGVTYGNVLDLINRLQEELNQYAEEHHNLMAKIEEKDKDIEKWQQVNFDLCTAGGKLLHERKTIRTEAYKEFAERLKRTDLALCGKDFWCEYIDNLLKEMVSGSE